MAFSLTTSRLKPVGQAFLVGVLVLLAIRAWDAYIPWSLSWNQSASIPEGLYLVKRIDSLPAVGGYVCFEYHAPAWAAPRHYFYEGYRLCKHLAGLPGQTVERIKGQDFVSDGHRLVLVGATQSADSAGRPLPQHALALGTIPRGMVVLAAPAHTNSMDSRYLGYVPQSAIHWQVYPLWTFR